MRLTFEFAVNAKEIETIKTLEKNITKIIRRQANMSKLLPEEHKDEGTPIPICYKIRAKSLLGAVAYRFKLKEEMDLVLDLEVSSETIALLANVVEEAAEVFLPLVEAVAAIQIALFNNLMDDKHPLMVAVDKLVTLSKLENEVSVEKSRK